MEKTEVISVQGFENFASRRTASWWRALISHRTRVECHGSRVDADHMVGILTDVFRLDSIPFCSSARTSWTCGGFHIAISSAIVWFQEFFGGRSVIQSVQSFMNIFNKFHAVSKWSEHPEFFLFSIVLVPLFHFIKYQITCTHHSQIEEEGELFLFCYFT